MLQTMRTVPNTKRQTTLTVSGMDCSDEVRLVLDELKPLAGVEDVRVNLLNSRVVVIHDDETDPERFLERLSRAGLPARLAANGKDPDAGEQSNRRRIQLIVISGALTGFGLLLHWLRIAPDWLTTACYVGAILSGGRFIFPKAVGAARRFSPDMNLLMMIAVIGAASIGEWSEGASVTFLFGLSELLESLSLARARRAIRSLLVLAPATALVLRGNRYEEVPVECIAIGEKVLVKSGQRIPVDGNVVVGDSIVDQAPITGESVPVDKRAGDAVFSGTINGEGSLQIEATKNAGETMLAQIVRLVSEAQAQKAPSQRFVDVFARYYTPAVMALAALTFVIPILLGGDVGTWFYRALVLLVIACPCALVISTPVSVVSGLTAMARHGVLIKGGAALEALGKLRALALDKTGTVTQGTPTVRDVIPVNGQSAREILRIAAAIDFHSEHPLARAIVREATDRGIDLAQSVDYRSIQGRGAEARVDGAMHFVGNHRLAHESQLCGAALEQILGSIEEQGLSAVVVGRRANGAPDSGIIGVISVGDSIRSHARQAIKAMHEAGVEKVVMLSGDNQKTVNAIARQAGIDETYGDLLPEDKLTKIHKLQSRYVSVGMIGDGVNDAPAMAAATIGIAMGKGGTDTAIETGDVALMQDDLLKVAEAIRLGRRVVRTIQFNIVFALAIKALFLVLAVFGYTSLWLAIAADMGATLVVIANALRLLRN
jgi:Zn2+/Cd2+-exporting ATPase